MAKVLEQLESRAGREDRQPTSFPVPWSRVWILSFVERQDRARYRCERDGIHSGFLAGSKVPQPIRARTAIPFGYAAPKGRCLRISCSESACVVPKEDFTQRSSAQPTLNFALRLPRDASIADAHFLSIKSLSNSGPMTGGGMVYLRR